MMALARVIARPRTPAHGPDTAPMAVTRIFRRTIPRPRLVCDTDSLSVHPPVDRRDLLDPASSIVMLQPQHLVVRPVKVIGDKGYLLVELAEGVADDPPRPSVSARNS